MSAWRGALVLAVAAALTACATTPPARVDAPPDAPAAAPPSTIAAAPPAAEPPRQADALARVASELNELQNAVAKLMMSARQHDDQLLYLQRRLTDLEAQARGRTTAPPAFAPSAAMPAPLPPPPIAPPVAPSVPAPRATPPPPAPPAVARATPAPRSPAPPSSAAPPANASPAETLYQSGLVKYQAGDLDGAVVSLYEVVVNFPANPARERAQFLVGEIFYAQKDYRGAIAELESLIGAVPAGSRVPDALLKIGLAQRSLGDDARARRTWERLVKDYPASAAARQARTLLRAAR